MENSSKWILYQKLHGILFFLSSTNVHFLHSPLPLAVVGQKLNFTKVKLKNKTAITEEFL